MLGIILGQEISRVDIVLGNTVLNLLVNVMISDLRGGIISLFLYYF